MQADKVGVGERLLEAHEADAPLLRREAVAISQVHFLLNLFGKIVRLKDRVVAEEIYVETERLLYQLSRQLKDLAEILPAGIAVAQVDRRGVVTPVTLKEDHWL